MEDGTLEGVAIQIEQSHSNDGMIDRRRTCVQACGVRRRTTVFTFSTFHINNIFIKYRGVI